VRYNVGMRRCLAVAALSVASLTLPAWGQRRGGSSGGFAGHAGFSGGRAAGFAGHSGFSGGHPAIGGRGPAMGARAFPGVRRGGVNFVMGNFGRGFGRGRFGYHHRRSWGWPYYGDYYGYSDYGYPWYYGDDSYSADSYQNYPPPDYSAAYAENDRQQAAIDRLENEVERLRQEREARESQSSQSRSKADSQLTELVFRDKHTEEVQNYAIVGQTLWILSAQRARKIALTELDIPATKKANDDRGVDFQLPG